MLVGDASVFRKQLPGAGFDKFERIPVAELDLSSPDLRRQARRRRRRRRRAGCVSAVAVSRASPQRDGRSRVLIDRGDCRQGRARRSCERHQDGRAPKATMTRPTAGTAPGRSESPRHRVSRIAFRIDADDAGRQLVAGLRGRQATGSQDAERRARRAAEMARLDSRQRPARHRAAAPARCDGKRAGIASATMPTGRPATAGDRGRGCRHARR